MLIIIICARFLRHTLGVSQTPRTTVRIRAKDTGEVAERYLGELLGQETPFPPLTDMHNSQMLQDKTFFFKKKFLVLLCWFFL